MDHIKNIYKEVIEETPAHQRMEYAGPKAGTKDWKIAILEKTFHNRLGATFQSGFPEPAPISRARRRTAK